jgi:hypothetical protein
MPRGSRAESWADEFDVLRGLCRGPPSKGAGLVRNHAMGGSNQMIFLITVLFVGQGAIIGQGSAAVPLLIFGVLLGWAAAPAWTELVLMWPNRVGGISAACAEAFRSYNPVLSAADRHLLSVGLGSDMRAHRAPLRLRHPAMVRAWAASRVSTITASLRRSCAPSSPSARRSTSR